MTPPVYSVFCNHSSETLVGYKIKDPGTFPVPILSMPMCKGQFHLPTCIAMWHGGYSALNSSHTLYQYVYSHHPSPPIRSTSPVCTHTWDLFLEPSAGNQTPNQVFQTPSNASVMVKNLRLPCTCIRQKNAPHHSPQ